VADVAGDPSLIRRLLAWEPRTAFVDGMRELAGWLAGQKALDRVDEATEALARRGLTA